MYLKIMIGAALLLQLGILVGFFGFPQLMNKMIKSQINLKPGSDTRKLWEQFPIAINFSIYVFNLTNPEETQNGGKPILQEIGPFVFEEWKDKYNIEDIEEEDAVTFNMRNTFIFRPDLGLSGEEIVTIPHPLIQVMAIAIKRDKEALLEVVVDGINVLFKPTNPFVTAPFMDIFYRGIDIDCSSDHYAAKLICLKFYTGDIKGGFQVNATHFKFSLMSGGNHSDAGQFKVSRGIKVSRNVGQVLQFDYEDELSVWDGDECNRFRGTDSTIFAPLMSPKDGLWSFSGDLCRSLGPKFQRKVKYDGIPAYRYTMDFGDVKNELENHCFCNKYPDDCPAKGTMDLWRCNETPMIASLPHFLYADSKLLAGVDGLEPQEQKHSIFVDFEIISGTPLSVAKRIQFNLDVIPIEQLKVMQKLRPLVMPLFWVEESANLDGSFTDMIKKKIFLVIKVNSTIKWISIVMGAFLFILAFYMHYTNKRDRKVFAVGVAAQNEFNKKY
ncbi:sensory neuron membrane protein 1-like [Teleopsis dalmanni]|uniref:sensory neuron membrane protein 1-like n=1 Tax=Teleopsis dalmanni TaxID=139649 RepID=UPI0018CDD2CD|nr:sensory neuron membrane protein 1-like [Teleopsis dalmanni]